MENLSTNAFRLDPIDEKYYTPLLKDALNEKLWTYSTIKIASEDDFKEYFHQALSLDKQTSLRAFVVYDLQKDRPVGMTRLYGFDSKNKSAKIGFTWYAVEQQGSGINTHVKYLMLQLAFDQLELERIELNADLRNKRSIAAMKKIGFQQEGILRKHMYLPDGYKRDTIVFSMLKEEWNSIYKSQLEEKIIG
ncbi:GNAT family protein [Faecalibacter sp. LW9]|uniref:GNAT family N-acetyltransferase n=1 Tax=Faecalibacter sp. LW9 TaxID=3103144 RepID=UPI002AFEA2CF|nr:GNAT family protein [Faecalibacter sp. LW9]